VKFEMCSAPSVIIIVWHASTLIFLFRPIAFYHLQNQNNSKYFFFIILYHNI